MYPAFSARQWDYGGYAPAVVDASRVIVNQAPPLGYLREVSPTPPERFYLDRRPELPEPAPPTSLVDLARAQIRVEEAEKDAYLVRWTGPAADVALVEFQAVDGTGQVLGSRLLREAPFRGLLRTPEKTASVLVTVEQKSGASATVKLPLAEFRALDKK